MALIETLASAKDPTLRASEIQDIGNAISVATTEYWDKLERWLNKVPPDGLDEVIIGGGAAYHVEPELEIYFNCSPKIETQYSSSRDSYGSGKKVRTEGYIPHSAPWGVTQHNHWNFSCFSATNYAFKSFFIR
ncbi:MAG: hypothetical protein KME57_24575 [Scytonema hyalinum WJT4-NPBG1]|nr:hypothetical protein [Scytonema hyalinum WJT4-NPBG1]